MEMWFWLITAHFIGDFIVQTDFLATQKCKNPYLMFVHCWLWSCCIFFVLSIYYTTNFLDFGFLVVIHYCIDKWKCDLEDKTHALTRDLYLDQLFHLIQIILMVCIYEIFIF